MVQLRRIRSPRHNFVKDRISVYAYACRTGIKIINKNRLTKTTSSDHRRARPNIAKGPKIGYIRRVFFPRIRQSHRLSTTTDVSGWRKADFASATLDHAGFAWSSSIPEQSPILAKTKKNLRAPRSFIDSDSKNFCDSPWKILSYPLRATPDWKTTTESAVVPTEQNHLILNTDERARRDPSRALTSEHLVAAAHTYTQ